MCGGVALPRDTDGGEAALVSGGFPSLAVAVSVSVHCVSANASDTIDFAYPLIKLLLKETVRIKFLSLK